MTAIARAACLSIACLAAMAHVGSIDTVFSGDAGPYQIRVVVRLPGVIPGRARVEVRTVGSTAPAVHEVSLRPIQWNVGSEGAPPAEIARQSASERNLHEAAIWLMTPTSYRLHVSVTGTAGSGTAIVPLVALATTQRRLTRREMLALGALTTLLCAGLLTLVRAGVRDAVLPPGAAPPPARRRTARRAVLLTAAIIAGAAWGAHWWWTAEADAYRTNILYRPFAADVRVSPGAGGQILELSIRDRRWPPAAGALTRYNALAPDHGKLMHLFLVREPDLDAFAHLHPVPTSAAHDAFAAPVPALPPGRYRLYADIVHESGYAQTIVSNVELGGLAAAAGADPDDSWFVGRAAAPSPAAAASIADGLRIEWNRDAPLVAGEDRVLEFVARAPTGSIAALEPYLGMAGHLAVTRDDGAVFAHLHPAGTVSMAALKRFAGEEDPVEMPAHHAQVVDGRVSIPYAFPTPGRYRLWLQIKHAGRPITAAFDADVLSAAAAPTGSY